MAFQILDGKRRITSLVLALAMGLTLASGFLPTLKSLELYLIQWLAGPGISLALFPLIALFLSWTLSEPPQEKPSPWDWKTLARQGIVAMIIAFLFGFSFGQKPSGLADWIWLCVSVPIGEECLFRGWVYRFFLRLFPNWFTATNPLPTAVVTSAIAFSAWHLQNLGTLPFTLVGFQCGYALFVGLWLGSVRWKNQGLGKPVLLHSLINLSALFGSLTN